MFAAVDAGDTKRATEIDGAEVDPSFDEIEKRISVASTEHRDSEMLYFNRLSSIQAVVAIATPVVLAFGMALAFLFWRVLVAFRRETIAAMLSETTAASRSEKRFRALVHNSSDVVLICNASGIITYQGPTAESAWGYGADALLRQPITSLIHADDQAAWRDF
jgi:PAS domain-containing protein